jgi:hypothetical protein
MPVKDDHLTFNPGGLDWYLKNEPKKLFDQLRQKKLDPHLKQISRTQGFSEKSRGLVSSEFFFKQYPVLENHLWH